MSERLAPAPEPNELWRLGPNYASDAVVIADGRVLLVKRRDTGLWALPGGFVDEGESSLEAAKREVVEETGFEPKSQPIEIYRGPVDDPRNSDQRWIESTAYLYTEPETEPVAGSDDVEAAAWFGFDAIPDELHGSHMAILEMAATLLSSRST